VPAGGSPGVRESLGVAMASPREGWIGPQERQGSHENRQKRHALTLARRCIGFAVMQRMSPEVAPPVNLGGDDLSNLGSRP